MEFITTLAGVNADNPLLDSGSNSARNKYPNPGGTGGTFDVSGPIETKDLPPEVLSFMKENGATNIPNLPKHVPEPSVLMLLGIGLIIFIVFYYRNLTHKQRRTNNKCA